jgi:hypothetical protein
MRFYKNVCRRNGREAVVGHVGVKLEIRASVTVLGEMSTCSLVVMNLPFGGV